jgi:biopolymer transport protein ExbD
MRTRIRKNEEVEVTVNTLCLLIPPRWLAMETASMAAISVTAPRTSTLPGADDPTTKEKLGVKVRVNSDGFVVEAQGQALDPISATRRADGSTRYDFAALEATARELKATAPEEIRVRVTAENDVEYADLIAAMDALRGSDCKLGGAGEEASPDCYFWAPVIESH